MIKRKEEKQRKKLDELVLRKEEKRLKIDIFFLFPADEMKEKKKKQQPYYNQSN